jgi:predicted RNase H-like HicB family nuclease/DNA-binding XRE family transcriptional regulator
MSPELRVDEYPFTVRPLSKEDGGGYLVEYPDLPGCVSDGDTPEDAVRNGRDAILAYIRSCMKHADPVPAPSSTGGAARVPGKINVKQIRVRTKLSQAEFARRFRFNVRTVQDWELGRSKPDIAVRAYLTVIAKNREAVEDVLVR